LKDEIGPGATNCYCLTKIWTGTGTWTSTRYV